MAYSWNERDLQRLAATYVDRILKGANRRKARALQEREDLRPAS